MLRRSAQPLLGPASLGFTWHQGIDSGGGQGLLVIVDLTTSVTLEMSLAPDMWNPWGYGEELGFEPKSRAQALKPFITSQSSGSQSFAAFGRISKLQAHNRPEMMNSIVCPWNNMHYLKM